MKEALKAIGTWFLSLFNFGVYMDQPSTLDRIQTLRADTLEIKFDVLNMLLINEYVRTLLMIVSVLVILNMHGESILLRVKAVGQWLTSTLADTKLGKYFSKWRSSKPNKQKKTRKQTK